MISSEQVRAARALLRWEQKDLAEASGVSLPSLKRLETQPGLLAAHNRTVEAITKAFQDAGVIFLADAEASTGGAGVRLTQVSAVIAAHSKFGSARFGGRSGPTVEADDE